MRAFVCACDSSNAIYHSRLNTLNFYSPALSNRRAVMPFACDLSQVESDEEVMVWDLVSVLAQRGERESM